MAVSLCLKCLRCQQVMIAGVAIAVHSDKTVEWAVDAVTTDRSTGNIEGVIFDALA